MLKGIVDSLKENDGNFSSTRFSMYATAIVILTTYVAHNIVSMFNSNGYIDFPSNTVFILGIVLTGKVVQKFAEK